MNGLPVDSLSKEPGSSTRREKLDISSLFSSLANSNQHFTLSVNMRESKVTVQLLLCEKSALLVLFFKGVLICKQLCLERKSI